MRMKQACALLLTVLLAVCGLGLEASAANTQGSIAVEAVYAGTPVPGMKFSLYKVAELDEYGKLTPTPKAVATRVSIPGEISDGKAWSDALDALAAYADQLDKLAEANTDANGKLSFPGSYDRGVYLILGESVTVGGRTYSAATAWAQLPALSAKPVAWDYDVLVKAKLQVSGSGNPKTLQVVKAWNDAGMEQYRPQSVTVELLRDNVFWEAQTLSAPAWSYTWPALDGSYVWDVREVVPDGYQMQSDTQGNVTTITNTPDVLRSDPPVQKIIQGSGAPTNSRFSFKMEAVSGPVTPIPMPAGSVNGVKTVTITGAGSYEFGEFALHEVGAYVYKISEVKGGEAGWTYDTEVYTLTVEVSRDASGKLSKTETLTDHLGQTVAGGVSIFTNSYSSTPGPSPNPVSVTLDVSKVLKGSPKTTADFAFRLVGKNGAPMPSGTSGSQKNVKVHGQGNASFGAINFTEPGTYVYEVSEVNDKLSGYTYDTNTYTVTVTITKNAAGNLTADISAVNSSKQSVKWDELVFTNTYKEPAPQTGILWWPVPVLLSGGLLLVLMGIIRRRKYEN